MISLFMCKKAEIDARITKKIEDKKKDPPIENNKKEIKHFSLIFKSFSLFVLCNVEAKSQSYQENHEPFYHFVQPIDADHDDLNPLSTDALQEAAVGNDSMITHPRDLNSTEHEPIYRRSSTHILTSTLSPFQEGIRSPDLYNLQQNRVNTPHSPLNVARILVLDGGGVRGLMELAFLDKLEQATGLKTAQLFHMVGGTSAGGKIAALLSVIDPATGEARYSAGQLKRIFLQKYDDMFSLKLKTLFGIFGEKYKTTPVKKIIESLVGEQYYSETVIPTFAIAYDLTATGEDFLKVFSSESDTDVRMKDVILATTAAPSYFKSHKIEGHEYADGGLILNNPAVVAINEAHRLFPSAANYVIVSLGSGIFPDVRHRPSLRHRSILSLASEVPSMLLHGQNNAAREGLLFRENVVPFRFTAAIKGKKIDLDDVSQKNINRMLEAVDHMWVNDSDNIRKLLLALPHVQQNVIDAHA
ncbi:MAG: hypothetical protein CNLJKLNK_00699 [Holosporales bacterium]